jgi:replicative DNA helicase
MVTALDDPRRNKTDTTRVPPHDLGAEQAVLGALLISRNAIVETVATGLIPDEFYKPVHGHIYHAILTVDAKAQPVDPVTVADQLATHGLLDTAGGLPGIAALSEGTPSTTRVSNYAGIVRRHAQLRQMIGTAGEIAEIGYAGGDADESVERAQELVFALTVTGETRLTPIDQAAGDWLAHLEDVIANGGQIRGVRTGLADLDNLLWGLRPGQLITIAGRPGSGKSVLGLQIAAEAALAGTGVLLATIEMSSIELTERLISNLARVPAERLRSGNVRDSDLMKISAAVARIGACPFHYLDSGTVTINHIRSHARRLAAQGSLGLIVVDYLQLLTPASKRENRQVEVSEMSGGLKRLAREIGVPIIALAQLNRGLEMRADKHPLLSDLRESGSIENDSDVVIGIYRDEMYVENSSEKGTADLTVLKQRSGPQGLAHVVFQDWIGRFENMARLS